MRTLATLEPFELDALRPGRIVHLYLSGTIRGMGGPFAAIVTKTPKPQEHAERVAGLVNLVSFEPDGARFGDFDPVVAFAHVPFSTESAARELRLLVWWEWPTDRDA